MSTTTADADSLNDLSNVFEKSLQNNNDENQSSRNKTEIAFLEKPNQPLVKFPANNKNRKFQASWYSKYFWLHYDIELDAAFCFICKQFPLRSNDKPTFKTTGFRDWHNAIRLFNVHQQSESHLTNHMLWKNKVRLS